MNNASTVILLLLLASAASAETITDVNLWVGVDGYTWVEEKMLVESGKMDAEAMIPHDASDLSVADQLGRLNYTIIPAEKYDIVSFKFSPVDVGDEKTVWIKYGTPHLTRKEGVNWTISYFTACSPRRTIVRVNFPVGSTFESLMPENLLRSFEKYAVWIFPQEDYLEFNCTYEYAGQNTYNGNVTVNYSSTSQPAVVDSNYVIMLIIAIAVISGIAYLAWRMELFKKEIKGDKRGDAITVSVEQEETVKGPSIVGDSLSYDIEGSGAKKGKRKVKESVLKMLEDHERSIIKILESSAEEEVTQAYVHKLTGIPKSSLSDIIKRLEKRNILETSSQGRIKWLKLQKWVLD